MVNAESLAGKLVQVTGSVLVKQADGKVKLIDQNADIAQGDTLVTDGKTYARIQLTDASEIALAPKSTFVIDRFNYDKNIPAQNYAEFNLIRGGVQFTSGNIAKNNKDGFVMKTSLGEIKGAASFIIEYTQGDEKAIGKIIPNYPMLAFNDTVTEAQSDALPDYGIAKMALAQNMPPTPPAAGLAPGLYVHVIDGIINLSNKGGTQNFSAGQFGYTASFVQPPVVVPANPGIQFTPPPAFSSSTAPSTSTSGNKSGSVDCEVR